MAWSNADENQVWSEEAYTLRNVVYDIGLPTLVKVSEGIYSDNEAESFSCGDLIKLDFQKSMTKISARFLNPETMSDMEVDQFGYHKGREDILIPVDYKGRIKVIQKDTSTKMFNSVEELVRDFPRYVRVDKGLKVNSTKLSRGSVLELDRHIPAKGLVCRLGEVDIILNISQKGKFTLLPDENIYTLRKLIDKFQLPQYVQFLDEDFKRMTTEDLDDAIVNFKKYTGCMKLQKVVKQKVIIGHHKALKPCRKTHCERSIALFPLDSLNVTDILVHVPMYTDTDDYQLILARNFSKHLDTNENNGVIYLEFAKNARVRLLNTNRFSPKRHPLPDAPLLPSDVKTPKPGAKSATSKIQLEYEDAITPATPKLLEEMRKIKSDFRKQKGKIIKNQKYALDENSDSYSDDGIFLKPSDWEIDKVNAYIEPIEWYQEPKSSTNVVPKPTSNPLLNGTPISSSNTLRKAPNLASVQTTQLRNNQKSEKIPRQTSKLKSDQILSQPAKPSSNRTAKMTRSAVYVSSKSTHRPKTSFYRAPIPLPNQDLKNNQKAKLTPKYENIMDPIADIFKTSASRPFLPSPTMTKKTTFIDRQLMPLPPIPSEKTYMNYEYQLSLPKNFHLKATRQSSKGSETQKKKFESRESRKESDSKEHPHKTKLHKTMSNAEKETTKRPSRRPVSFFDRDDTVPVVEVKPQVSRESVKEGKGSLINLSVEELVSTLKVCGLRKLAKVCEREMLDGSFLTGLSQKELKDSPFGLLPMQLRKIESMKDGWRPKRMTAFLRASKTTK